MKTMLQILIFPAAVICRGALLAQEPIQPAEMSEKALLAKARQIVQEEFELSKIAVKQARSAKVKEFAERAAKRGGEMDKKLTELAASAGVPEPQKISQPMQERLAVIAKAKGEAFDPDYLDMLLDMQSNNLHILEELARRAEDPKLRDFAREALATERAERGVAQKLAAHDLPHVAPQPK